MSSGHKTNIQRNNVSKIERKEKIQKSSIHPSYTHSPNHKISYTNPPPMSITLISKLLTLFVTSDKGQVHQVDISSSLGELASSSSLASSLLEPSSLLSSDASGEGEEATVKPPMAAYRHAIRLTWVFTWHNSSLRVSRWACMRASCAMMVSSVTPLAEDEGAEVDGAAETRGAAVCV